ncbi:hypothetical protein Poli38472_001479 [Pythium oligandrum]|uniref:GRIP domain-containing protein n=1 Tax=Pythium oligandrum TaxID=41045 RepID=A0A8K1CW38_PYTOL|nr:hypothetical protein Poli38472_001479 [Pythium oligandrum]|eukprot:TMW69323.1 hypothetical protein Poli38472_001479 [Pythium oligandrum]
METTDAALNEPNDGASPVGNEQAEPQNDVQTQLRAWKERSTRMEVLLAKRSAKIQEMEETETKLKRLLAMAKRSIDNSKQELADKDAEIEQLRAELATKAHASHTWETNETTRDPRRILSKVAQGNTLWCLVEYASDDSDDTSDFAWHRFQSEEQIKAYANRANGEPLALPSLSLTPFEVERMKKDLKEEIDRVQEEFRRYRVRAEITRKQKDAEIRKMSANAVARQAEQISETDLSGELQSARAQIRRLSKQQAETEEREAEWRRKFEKLMKDYEKLSGTMGETVLATEWRERYEQAVREREDTERKMEELRSALASTNMNVDLQSLRQEFAQYRRRAMNAVDQKDRELHEIQSQYYENGSANSSRTGSLKDFGGPPRSSNGNGPRPLRRMSSNNSLGGLEVPNVTTTNEYLKNIVYKYMTTEQDEAKEHMEKAIATVLNFTPAESQAVQEKRRAQAGAQVRRVQWTAERAMAGGQQKKTAPVVGDARFQKVHNDPRFARVGKRKNKLQIDQRFAGVLKDERFQAVQGKYDKYGRRLDKSQNELKKFYRLEDDEEEDKEEASDDDEEEEKAVKATSSDEEEKESDPRLSRLEYLNRMARGELASGDESSSSSDDSDMSDAEVEEYEEKEKEDVPMGEETKRFAVLNCDWTRIRAVDIFALCQSFAPATGAVKDVTIYPSDFGLEKMKEEEQHGPRQLWADKQKKANESATESEEEEEPEAEEEPEEENDDDSAQGDDDDDDDDDAKDGEEDGYDSDDPLGVKKSVNANETEGFDQEKLRKYELQKLKYYYAVVTCDSIKTASVIYENCDQLEYETSSNLLDLRFIPDDMEFKNPPRESCRNVPEHYKPAIFATRALQQTDVTLTWEEDDDQRLELLTRQAEWKNANDDDFSAYLASENSSSEDEDDDEDEEDDAGEEAGDAKKKAEKKKAAKLKKIKNRYRKMLLGSDAEDSDGDDDASAPAGGFGSSSEGEQSGSGSDANASDDDDDDGSDSGADGEEGNLEMTFAPDAKEILLAKRQKELEANETPFERYQREKKLEKNKKQHEKRKLQKQEAREQREVLKKKGKNAAPEQLKALRDAIDGDSDNDASDDDEGGDRNFDMKKIALNEKVKGLKGKRKAKELKKLSKKTGLQEGFEFDAADPRFGALYKKGTQFQLDPTDPKFKKTEATDAIFQERRKRQSEQTDAKPAKQQAAETEKTTKGDKSELKSMVENLKRKAAQQSSKKGSAPKPFKKPKM